MSWSARGTKSTKNRILTIEKRTVNTTIPSLDSLFSTYVQEDHSNLAKNLIEQIYFSSFPDKDASATLSTLSINKYNIQNLKSSGSLGVIIEMLNRLEFSKSVDETFQDWNDHSENKKNKEITRGKSDDSLEGFHENQRVTRQDNHDDESVGGESTISHLTQPSYKSHQSKTSHTHHLRRSHGTSSTNIEEHVSDLINSISILTENDVDTCQRLLHHPNALINLLKLLKLSSGITQSKILLIIDKLCSTPHGMDTFLSHRIYTTLISYELLIRSSTLLHVRHHAAQLIHKLTNYNSKDFPILLLQDVILFDGECIVDGYIEVQLLNSIHSYLTYLSTENIPIPWCSAVMSHLINQIKDETFVDLEHVSHPTCTDTHRVHPPTYPPPFSLRLSLIFSS